MQLKTLADQRRVDFVAKGVWALKFFTEQHYNAFLVQFQNCTFENTHGYEATDENKLKDLKEEFEEAANGGIQSLALGALDNSFLVGENGIQVVKNFAHGIHGKGAFVNFGGGSSLSSSNLAHSTPKKTLLMKAETSMLLMSP
ncbi:protein CYPRO4-like, partial [Trifolium medium]|nr:protein CYPRO4-like [Trifolium medium]